MNEPIEVLSGEELSSSEIINDLLRQVENALSKNANLQETNAYRSYTAEIEIEIQLNDVDVQHMNEKITIGCLDAGRPSIPFEVEIPEAPAREVRERSRLPAPENLEHAVDGSIPQPARRKRFYAPRTVHTKQ